MAELADALDSGSSGVTTVEVRVLLAASYHKEKKPLYIRLLFFIRMFVYKMQKEPSNFGRFYISFLFISSTTIRIVQDVAHLIIDRRNFDPT